MAGIAEQHPPPGPVEDERSAHPGRSTAYDDHIERGRLHRYRTLGLSGVD